MRILELFSGTHSVGVVARSMGWEVVSLDLQDATITCDVLEWNYRSYPPCETFSNLRWAWVGRKLRRFGDVIVTPEMLDDDMMERGLPILRKTEEIIEYFKPRFYIIENPRSGRMKFITVRKIRELYSSQFELNELSYFSSIFAYFTSFCVF